MSFPPLKPFNIAELDGLEDNGPQIVDRLLEQGAEAWDFFTLFGVGAAPKPPWSDGTSRIGQLTWHLPQSALATWAGVVHGPERQSDVMTWAIFKDDFQWAVYTQVPSRVGHYLHRFQDEEHARNHWRRQILGLFADKQHRYHGRVDVSMQEYALFGEERMLKRHRFERNDRLTVRFDSAGGFLRFSQYQTPADLVPEPVTVRLPAQQNGMTYQITNHGDAPVIVEGGPDGPYVIPATPPGSS